MAVTNRELDAAVAEVIFGWRWYAAAWGSLRFLGNPNWTEDSPETPHWPLTEASTKLPLCDDWQRSVPRYTTDPTADYSVLKHCRDNDSDGEWTEFGCSLYDLWHSRSARGMNASGGLTWMPYEPGDYAKAKLASINLARISLQ